MANDKSNKKLGLANQGTYADRLFHMIGWAELIHKDVGDFIGALDRLYMEMQAAGKPASKDFLTAVNSNKE